MPRIYDRFESATLLLTRAGAIKDRLNAAWRQYLASLEPDDLPASVHGQFFYPLLGWLRR